MATYNGVNYNGNIHPGSWAGLPDFGITEAIGGLLGKGTTSQGGSNIVGGSTLGASTSNSPTYGPIYNGPQAPVSGSGGTGGTGSGSNLLSTVTNSANNAFSDAQARESAIRNSINSTYGNIANSFSSLLGDLPNQQNTAIGNLQSGMDAAKTGYQSALDNANAKIGTYKTDINTMAKTKSQEIADNLRQLMNASQQRIGVLGGGNSSASQTLLPWALGKQAAKAGAQVAGGAVSQMGELDRKAIDVQNTYDTSMAQLSKDFFDQKQSIIDRYNSIKMQIEQAKMGADERKMAALNALDGSLLSDSLNAYRNLQSSAVNIMSSIEDWKNQNASRMTTNTSAMGDMSNYNVQNLGYDSMQGVGDLQSGGAGNSTFSLNPLDLLRKKQEAQQM